MNVTNLLARSTENFSQQIAIVDGNRRITYAEAWDRGIRLANGLLSLGLRPQDRVGILEDNCLESADAYIGLAIANLVRVPLYAGSDFEVHSHMLKHTGCTALISSKERLNEVKDINIKHVIARDDDYETWLNRQSNRMPKINMNSDDTFIIRHSGGTSGLPKGIGITHKNWITSMRDWFFPLPSIIPGDAFLHVSPMSHASGYMFLPVWAAGGINIMSESFEPEACLEMMKQEGVTYLFVAPAQLNDLINKAILKEANELPKIKALMSGGAPIPAKVIKGIQKTFGDVFYQSYGQTEVGIVSIGSPYQWKLKSNSYSNPIMACGRPLPFVEIKIMNGDEALDYGQAGEIVVHTDGMMENYWGVNNTSIYDNRWIRTGDVGKLDMNGFLYILGRKEDVITCGECKIYPLEMENLLCSHTEVKEAAVVGIPDKEFVQVPLVYCKVKKNSSYKNEDVEAVFFEKYKGNRIPLNIRITTESLPKNNIGKLIRDALRE